MLVVNLFGGPGVGKSTTAAGVFSVLKLRGINCELVREYAKDKVWERSLDVLDDQIYIFGKQHHRLHILKHQVDVAITDSPLLLSIVYGKHEGGSFGNLVVDVSDRYNNLNYVLTREKEFNPAGHVQGEEKARDLDGKIRKLLGRLHMTYRELPGNPSAVDEVANEVELLLERPRKNA